MEKGNKYVECHKAHAHLDGKIDGCQEFWADSVSLLCKVCNCHRNFHRKVETPVVVYTKCHKILSIGGQASVDGCQEFTPRGEGTSSSSCALCYCDKGFHRNLLTA